MDIDRCGRCVLVNKSCDLRYQLYPELASSPYCQRCLDQNDLQEGEALRGWLLCKRTSELTKAFDDPASQVAIQIGHTKWVLQDEDGGLFKLSVSYNRTGKINRKMYAIVDLAYFEQECGSSTDVPPRMGFLNQFSSIPARWVNFYETITENLISSAAEYQINLLSFGNEDDETNDSHWIILNTLRCLIMCHSLQEIAGRISVNTANDNFPDYLCLQAPEVSSYRNIPRLEPLVEIVRLPPSANIEAMKKFDHTAEFNTLLKQVLNTAQSMLLRGYPRDWPAIFYVQVLLQIIDSDLEQSMQFTSNFSTTWSALRESRKILAQLFFFCCGENLHPFAEDFDTEWYSLMVGSGANPLIVEHYREQHNVWEQNREDGDRVQNFSSFFTQLDRYTFGFQ